MSPRKSRSDLPEASEYQRTLTKFCQEEDVLVIPIVRKIPSILDLRIYGRKTPEIASLPTEFDPEELCPPPPPPTISVAYDRESPVSIVCKAFYVEYALVRAIFASLANFSTIVSLKIEDCCISREIVSMLATLLASQPGKNIVDLSLDGNCDIAEELPSLLQTELKYLSLRRCSLDDEAVKLLSKGLCNIPSTEQNLLVLNLNMNFIGDEGVLGLATALRTNRTLISLSLCGNRITDKGAFYLAEALGKFSLTQEEIIFRRRRIFDRLILTKSVLQKLLDDWRMRDEAGIRARPGGSDRGTGRRTKSIESGPRKVATATRDKKRTTSTRMSSRETVRGRGKVDGPEGVILTPKPSLSELKELKMRAEKETPPDGHPFITEVTVSDSLLCCDGCWSLGNLNLSYNRITEQPIENFLAAIYHRDKLPPYRGLQRLIIQPGNLIRHNSTKLAELECVLKNISQRKVSPSDGRDQVESLSNANLSPKK